MKNALIAKAEQPALDFGKHVIPFCHENNARLFAYEYNGYWKDVGTLNSYWEANMELIDIVPEFNLYEEYWRIYTKNNAIPPQYISSESVVERSIIGEGTEIYGKVYNSVIGCNCMIGPDTVVRDSIIMNNAVIHENCELNKSIIAENTVIGPGCVLGAFDEVPNETDPSIYTNGLVTVGEDSVIPENVRIGRNSVVAGRTRASDYKEGILASGKTLIKSK